MPKQIIEGVCPECGADLTNKEHGIILRDEGDQCIDCNTVYRIVSKFEGVQIYDTRTREYGPLLPASDTRESGVDPYPLAELRQVTLF